MNSLLPAFALILAVLLVWWGLRRRGARLQAESHPAENVDTITGWMPQATRVLTAAERQAFEILRTALPAHIVLAQVPLARFIKVPTRNSYAEWLRRVGHLCADLVVCDRNSLVVAVIEIHPAIPVTDERVLRRQQRLARVLKGAAIPMHVWTENAMPSAVAAREAIAPAPPVTEPAPALPAKLARSLPGRSSLTGAARPGDDAAEPTSDETMALHEAPPSTWFDDLDTGPTPLPRSTPAAADKPADPSKDRAPR
ncbi:MAG TPA: DUF2726 domain-containing protein [Albitalea sp.]|nr:DUF2726 domain-containing protein [Albitalea sp.]